MPFVLVRIDDRLIHGQVAVAWGSWLAPDRIVLVNDEVATTEWKRDLYGATDALGAAVAIATIEQFLRSVREGSWESERLIVIVESPRDLLSLVRGGLEIASANVGGMHYSEGKRELLPYVFVDDEDAAVLREIIAAGTALEARDVPQAQPVDVVSLLERSGDERTG